MIKMIKWPSIGQYSTVVKTVQHQSSYVGMDADGKAVFDKSRKAPSLRFEGTAKLHGTNASVALSFDNVDNLWAQSRENIITPENDNAGFAKFVEARHFEFQDFLITAKNIHESHFQCF